MAKLLRRNIWIEVGISLFLLLFFIVFYANVEDWVLETIPGTLSPAFFPSLIAGFLVLMSALLLFFSGRALFHMLTGRVDKERQELQEASEEAGRFLALGGYIATLFFYLVALRYIGFVYSTPVVMFLVAVMLGLTRKRWVIGFVIYILFTLALNYAALHFMQIILPTGSLFE